MIESRAEVNTTGQDLVPTAEERSNYGKIVKQSIRGMWGLEYEIEDIQVGQESNRMRAGRSSRSQKPDYLHAILDHFCSYT